MPISIDVQQLTQIAATCQASSNTIQEEAARMQQQMQQLREALSGIPSLSLADRFDEWNRLFADMSNKLEESNHYLNNVVSTVDQFVASLGR